MLKIIKLLIFIWIIPVVWGQYEWELPYFLEPDNENVFFGDYNSRIQVISVYEEIPVPFDIAEINYFGSESIAISGFIVGSNVELEVVLVKEKDRPYVVRVNRFQDYEKISSPLYRFAMKLGDRNPEVAYSIQLNIINLIDTEPTIEYAPCTIKELQPAGTPTNCFFDVTVADGFSYSFIGFEWTNTITPYLNGAENELFEFISLPNNIVSKTAHFQLKLKEELRYEIKPLYNFRSYFKNSADLNNSILTIIELEDIPSMPPTWIKSFEIEILNEKEYKYFIVEAIDGDTGINANIQFSIKFDDKDEKIYNDLIVISQFETNKAKIELPIDGIDRDALQNEIYRFNITAFKIADATVFETESIGLIVINDINDQTPNITLSDIDGNAITEVWINEETFLTLPINKIIVYDRDLQENAMHTVRLAHDDSDPDGPPFSTPFTIVPGTGYQKSEFFKIDVFQNKNYLDYEDEIWRSFDIIMIAEEIDTPEQHFDQKIIKIKLNNWNDELPIFENNGEYTVDILENITESQFIYQVQATDRDVGDKVIHSILGNLKDLLDIDPKNGNIMTKNKDTFDYEKQTEVILQVMAEDTLDTKTPGEVIHKVYAQLTINILDVNDETPELKLLTVSPETEENVPGGYVLLKEAILATDPDTTANLEFSILWDETSATKSGQKVTEEYYYTDCFIIEKQEISKNAVWGNLIVNNDFVKPGVDIDYEKFEVLYLTIVVEDLAQEQGPGIAKAQITIRIIDLNDNAPEFIENTLEIERNVLEEARANTQIGTILAEDIDGPNFNNISYSIKPTNSTIPNDWIVIDDKGVIRVNADKQIDCDEPQREYLEYKVTLSDIDHITEGNINIHIIDTNNKIPQISDFVNFIEMKEKQNENGRILTTINVTDADRDEHNRNFMYLIDKTYQKAGSFFELNITSGELAIKLIDGAIFDYDEGDQYYDIPIEVYDSDTNIANRNITQVRINLTDVNDHKPVFKSYSPTILENSVLHAELDELCATDKDSGNNSLISFKLISIEPHNGVVCDPPSDVMLFEIKETVENCMRLYVATLLHGCYGTWAVTIFAKDNGEADLEYSAQNETGVFYVEIIPYNLNNPKIMLPDSGSIRLSNSQGIKIPVVDTSKETFPPFLAFDPDGGIFGEVTFKVLPTAEQDLSDADYFEFSVSDGKRAYLQLSKELADKNVYYITCIAYDGGDKQSEPLNLMITFVNVDGDLYFEVLDDFAFFKEKELSQSYTVLEGKNPLNEGLDEENYEKVYYFLANTKSAEYFDLDVETRELKLIKELDRTEQEKHLLEVILSREIDSVPNVPPHGSVQKLSILVTDVNVDLIKPTIFYPNTNTLRLPAAQLPDRTLYDLSNSELRPFEAFGRNTDKTPSDIRFLISNVPGDLEDAEYFKFLKTDKTSTLQLAKEIDGRNQFNIRVTAVDSSDRESQPLNLKITFVDTIALPYFKISEDLVFLRENEIGLINDFYTVPKATEPLNEGLEVNDPEHKKLYYFIDLAYNSPDSDKFNLNSETGILTIREKLNRQIKETHEIRLVVSRLPSGPPNNPSSLLLTIIVQDINDNPPVFDKEIYGAGITTSDRTGKIIQTVQANDLDLNETITYHLLTDTFKAIGEGIDAVQHTAFSINSENNLGHIILNIEPKNTMLGYFEFMIEARDNDQLHSDQALMKVYLITDANRVTFVFVNAVNDIEFIENSNYITNLFSDKFGFTCHIDETQPATNDNGVPIENLTNVIIHFINNKTNEAIPAETIQAMTSDVVFLTQLKSLLAQKQLILQEVPTGTALNDDTNKAELLQTILIVLSVVLGILCAVLIVAFFIRTRNLRRQLKAMSTVDFGSTSSNLNRREAPTTNVFSVEGSNPVLNNNNIKPMFDSLSVHSDESDFGGIHNDPTFSHRRESVNPELIEEIRRKSVNPMVNGNAKSNF